MFIILLKFAENRDQSDEYLDGHVAWLKRGFEDGVFLAAGLLQPDVGGGILAQDASRAAIESRAAEDPYVANRVVTAEIYEMDPSRTDERLAFLKAP